MGNREGANEPAAHANQLPGVPDAVEILLYVHGSVCVM